MSRPPFAVGGAAAEPPVRWESKVEAHAAVAAAAPPLALPLTVFSTQSELGAYLEGADATVVLRPEYSADTGSALFHSAGCRAPEAALAALWAGGGRVVAHPYLPGTPHFANGMVVDGKFLLTDCWRCFLLPEGARRALVSVVNPAPGAQSVGLLAERLRDLPGKAGLEEGPLHIEAVVAGEGEEPGESGGHGAQEVKIVKLSPREAGHPLPALRAMLGIGGHERAVPYSMHQARGIGFAGDYSFRASHPGRLVEIDGLADLRARPSHAADELLPQPGDRLVPPGPEAGTMTFLLHHREERTILADIAYYRKRQRDGVFRLESAE